MLSLNTRLQRGAQYVRFCLGVAVLVLLTVLVSGSARAASLALIACDGSSANEGWSTFSIGSLAYSTTASCSEPWSNEAGEPWGFPAGMDARFISGTVSDARTGLVFQAPTGESIVGGDITVGPVGNIEPPFEETSFYPRAIVPSKRAELALGSLERVFWYGINQEPSSVAIPSSGADDMYASVLCGGEPGRRCGSQALYVPARILLAPRARPIVSTISGSLSSAGVMHGTQGVSFTASDEGPGVYQVAVAIDGETVYQATPNLNGGVCAPVGTDGSSLEFYTAEPCPQSVSMSIPIHTASLTDGIHALTVTATDAASNVSSASEIIFRSENLISTASAGRVPRNKQNPVEPAYLIRFDGRTFLLSHGVRRSYSQSSLTLSGTLATPQDAVAPDVPIDLLAREGTGSNGAEKILASTTTDAAGHWSLTAPKGPSRTLRVSYSQANTASAQTATTVKESVSPTISLRIRDKRGGRLSFTGTVSISPLGQPRPIVLIEASSDAHHWQTVGREVRTNAHGDYNLSYSSPQSIGGRFAFRALTPETSLWLQSDSRTRWIRVH